MRHHLVIFLATMIAMLVWASGAFAANTLTLCVNKASGAVTAPKTCKGTDTSFTAVSSADLTALETRVSTLEGKVSALEAQNVAQQTAIDGFAALLAGVTRTAGPTLLFTGLNLQVVNGSGNTDRDPTSFPPTSSANGLGNIIVGYNTSNGDTKTGSHNLVIGDKHSYTSTSGVVTGVDNELSGITSFVGGGDRNKASGPSSFVGGGSLNTASQTFAFVGGGQGNTASGIASFVGGGQNNIASGSQSFVGGSVGQTAGLGSCANIFGTIFPGPTC